MKKMLLILALATISFANAQKGTVLVGGNIEYNSVTYDHPLMKTKTNEFGFSPKVGYQFHDNWTIGGEFTVLSSKQNGGGLENKNNTYSYGAFVRYTVPLSETFSVFADLGAGFQNQKSKNLENGSVTLESKADGLYVGITPAIFINVKKGFGLNFNIGGLGYETLSFDTSDTDVRRFYFNFGKTVNIGVSKNF